MRTSALLGCAMAEIFDYVIVGAGSAGCVMANRLTEDGTYSVKVLEFGGSDASVFIQMPSALSIPMNSPRYDWRYHAEPEPALGGRSLHTPRGKVLGGSSSINGMVYIRGHALDFDAWEEVGARGWNYASVLPYFKRAEGRREGGDAYRGADGPLKTSYGTMRNPLYQAFIDAAIQAGYPATNDVNGYQQEGFGRMDMTVFRGRRWSAANAYLKPAIKRANLSVETHALASRIVFQGKRAVGVEYWHGSQLKHVKARREVILAAGPSTIPSFSSSRASARRRNCRRRASRLFRTCPVSARTCRTTSNSISRWRVRSPSPSIRRSIRRPRLRSERVGCCAMTGLVPPITSRAAASSARARELPIPTYNIISCRWPWL